MISLQAEQAELAFGGNFSKKENGDKGKLTESNGDGAEEIVPDGHSHGKFSAFWILTAWTPDWQNLGKKTQMKAMGFPRHSNACFCGI
jgi:hypothetical protein